MRCPTLMLSTLILACSGDNPPTCDPRFEDCHTHWSATAVDTATSPPCAQERYFLDVDGDGFGVPSNYVDACEPVQSYRATKGGDCCDTDSLANPTQDAYFEKPNACGSFDYDCNGIDEQEVTQCGPDAGCETHWSWCPTPACGVDGVSIVYCEGTPGGLSSSSEPLCGAPPCFVQACR